MGSILLLITVNIEGNNVSFNNGINRICTYETIKYDGQELDENEFTLLVIDDIADASNVSPRTQRVDGIINKYF